ncbi:hypothetical protein [Pseudobacillus badius]|uniref:hypothetical protein n=1 Tax=Bacillus badius TaxID=1455 RepID=UPI0007B3EDE5|nr:hypothetical protein [Bacillus badius]KZR57520.1 hypothetical protein A3781_19705 [Bacillus badius]
MNPILLTDVPAITSEQSRALRSASYILFNYRQGRSYIRAVKENVGVWKETKEIEIDCGLQIENYGTRRKLGNVRSAVHLENHLDYNGHIKTVLRKIKKGDKLTLRWVACNNNNLLDTYNLIKDELYLIIHRKNNDEYYLIESQVSLNDVSRMIKNDTTPMSVVGE